MSQTGVADDRPAAKLYALWVAEAGGYIECPMDPEEQRDAAKVGVVPLQLFNIMTMRQSERLFQLLRKSLLVIGHHLSTDVFPNLLRYNPKKLSASGQELGGPMLFHRRIGFSGTPNWLIPRDLQCRFEDGCQVHLDAAAAAAAAADDDVDDDDDDDDNIDDDHDDDHDDHDDHDDT